MASSNPKATPVRNTPATDDKNKQYHRETLMDRIRSRSHRSFQELARGMRMSMLDRRYALDAVEKANLQRCLDSMQHCIKVTSREALVERLESLSRQLGLKFMEDQSGLFISTDMFFLEILVDANGKLTDVKVHHECKVEQQSCSELVSCLNRGDFADFTVQLEGLSSIYQLNAEPNVKKKAFIAMQAIEKDLYAMYEAQNAGKDAEQLLRDCSVGIVRERLGGHPMRLTYFVSPYDLIEVKANSVQPMSLELVNKKGLGYSATVNLEAASTNQLQILPTVSYAKDPQTGREVPTYAPLTQANSMLLPATFVLRLNKPLPVCRQSLAALGIPMAEGPKTESTEESTGIMKLIVQTASEQELFHHNKGLFVNLPDQTHCYFFNDDPNMQATLLKSVPFTEPSQVPGILQFLKKEALFYTLVSSCVRPKSKMGLDMDSTTMLEVDCTSFEHISVSLQHPFNDSMATIEFEIVNGTVQCSLYMLDNKLDSISRKLTAVVQKCMSIPVTVRACLKFWDQERLQVRQQPLSSTDYGGNLNDPTATHGTGNSMPSSSNATFGNLHLMMGAGDSGGRMAGASDSSGDIGKMDPSGSSSSFMMAGGIGGGGGGGGMSTAPPAGYMKFPPSDEDFHESPKSQAVASTSAAAAGSTSMLLAAMQEQQQHQQRQQQHQLQQQSVDSSSSLGLQIFNQQQQQQGQGQQQQDQIDSPSNTTTTSTQLQTAKQSVAVSSRATTPSPSPSSSSASFDFEIADKYKNIWKEKTPNLQKHSGAVSITAIPPGKGGDGLSSSGLDSMQRGGVEIIPLTAGQGGASTSGAAIAAAGGAASTTITITPIVETAGAKGMSSGSSMAGASSSSASMGLKRSLETTTGLGQPFDPAQKEKKRKKKRDDSPMGPPDKVYSRQNSPASTGDSGGPAVSSRKFPSPSSSPKGGSGGSAGLPSYSARPSPKHSPVYSSPKHNTASNSPKSPFGTHSPKHGSSGKPSMSTLKSATAVASSSPKGDKNSGSSISAGGSGGAGSMVGNVAGNSPMSLAGIGGPGRPSGSQPSMSGGGGMPSSLGGGLGSSTGASGNGHKMRLPEKEKSQVPGATAGPSLNMAAGLMADAGSGGLAKPQQQSSGSTTPPTLPPNLASGGAAQSQSKPMTTMKQQLGGMMMSAAEMGSGGGGGGVDSVEDSFLADITGSTVAGAVSLMTSAAPQAASTQLHHQVLQQSQQQQLHHQQQQQRQQQLQATAQQQTQQMLLQQQMHQQLKQQLSSSSNTSSTSPPQPHQQSPHQPHQSGHQLPHQQSQLHHLQQQQQQQQEAQQSQQQLLNKQQAVNSLLQQQLGESSKQHQQQLLENPPQLPVGSSSNSIESASPPLQSPATTTKETVTSADYVIKSSQEGLKLTINKTNSKNSPLRTKSSSIDDPHTLYGFGEGSSSSSKKHTGLKPGVNSGPASKKSPNSQLGNTSGASPSSTTTTTGGASKSGQQQQSTKHIFQKANSSGNLSAKLSSSAGGSTLSKSGSSASSGDLAAVSQSKSKGSNGGSGGGSSKKFSSSASSSLAASLLQQSGGRVDHNSDRLKILQYASPSMATTMEAFMKGFNNKFQIPKLSQRAASSAASSSPPITTGSTTTTTAGAVPPLSLTTSNASVTDSGSGKQQASSAPVTPTNVSPPTLTMSTTSATPLQAGPQQKPSAQPVTRSPPPPYHIAVATATGSKVGNTNTPPHPPPPPPPLPQSAIISSTESNTSPAPTSSAISTQPQQSTVSMHAILKSPLPSVSTPIGSGGGSASGLDPQPLQQAQQQQALDFLTAASGVGGGGGGGGSLLGDASLVSNPSSANSKSFTAEDNLLLSGSIGE